MKKFIPFILIIALCSCSLKNNDGDSVLSESSIPPSEASYIQEFEQLHIDMPEKYATLNYEYTVGKWFPYMQYEEYMYGKTAEEFRQSVRELFSESAENGINTVYLHVHPCGDAYYSSEIFPRGVCLDGDYDPLEIMLEEAHEQKLSAHAWLNPLRCQTKEQMKKLSDKYVIKKWADDENCGIIKMVGERWYLDPSYSETRELIAACVDELLDNYELDGVHIDDYFYPTTDTAFDEKEFLSSGSSDLSAWRTENCTSLVKTIYDTVKKHDERIIFGISPQGNINANYTSQYADVRLWGGSSGYCDQIIPQIYFGFRNTTCPFEETLDEWEKLCGESGVKLIVGLAEYKQGKEDKWAGAAGEREWIEDPDVIEKQTAVVKASSAKGYAFYG